MTSIGYIDLLLPGLVALMVAASATIVLAGWIRRGRTLARQAEPQSGVQFPRFELGRTPFASGVLDVATELRTVLGHLTPLAGQHYVQLEIAVQPDLAVRADPRILREVVGDLVANAIREAPCGRVLVGGMRHGGRVQISISHDGAGKQGDARDAVLRDAERLIALQGGTVHMEVQVPGEGSTVVVRLPEPAATTRAAATAKLPAAQSGVGVQTAHAAPVP